MSWFYFFHVVLINVAAEKSAPLIIVFPEKPPKDPRLLQSELTTSVIMSAPQLPGSNA